MQHRRPEAQQLRPATVANKHLIVFLHVRIGQAGLLGDQVGNPYFVFVVADLFSVAGAGQEEVIRPPIFIGPSNGRGPSSARR